MPLPTSGPISLEELQTEFGGVNPISFNEYYRDGVNVGSNPTTLNMTANGYPAPVGGGIPTSGAINLNLFRGTSKRYSVNVTVAASTTNYVLRSNIPGIALFTSPIDVSVYVNTGVNISGSTATQIAFTIAGTYPAGSTITLYNSGAIAGLGGAARALGATAITGNPGGVGLSITTTTPVTIINNYIISGGGGSGGRGGDYIGSACTGTVGGNGGVGGIGISLLNATVTITNNNSIAGGGGGGGGGGSATGSDFGACGGTSISAAGAGGGGGAGWDSGVAGGGRGSAAGCIKFCSSFGFASAGVSSPGTWNAATGGAGGSPGSIEYSPDPITGGSGGAGGGLGLTGQTGTAGDPGGSGGSFGGGAGGAGGAAIFRNNSTTNILVTGAIYGAF